MVYGLLQLKLHRKVDVRRRPDRTYFMLLNNNNRTIPGSCKQTPNSLNDSQYPVTDPHTKNKKKFRENLAEDIKFIYYLFKLSVEKRGFENNLAEKVYKKTEIIVEIKFLLKKNLFQVKQEISNTQHVGCIANSGGKNFLIIENKVSPMVPRDLSV